MTLPPSKPNDNSAYLLFASDSLVVSSVYEALQESDRMLCGSSYPAELTEMPAIVDNCPL